MDERQLLLWEQRRVLNGRLCWTQDDEALEESCREGITEEEGGQRRGTERTNREVGGGTPGNRFSSVHGVRVAQYRGQGSTRRPIFLAYCHYADMAVQYPRQSVTTPIPTQRSTIIIKK